MKNKPVLSILCVCILLLVFPAGPGAATTPDTPQSTPEAVAAPEFVAGNSYLSIPAAAFVPQSPDYNFENHGRYIKHFNDAYNPVTFRAAVNLPHGATIASASFCFYDDAPGKDATASLNRDQPGQDEVTMASVGTSGSGTFSTITDNSIIDPVVNNVNSVYWVEMSLPTSTGAGNDVWGCGATIRYNPPAVETGILVIPGSVFKPFEDGYGYFAFHSYITHEFSPGLGSANGHYLAQVDLPNGAVVTKLTLKYYDYAATAAITAWLQRGNAGSYYNMASISSLDGMDAERSTTTIADATIENNWNSYWVSLDMPQSTVGNYLYANAVKIEYAFPTGNPSHILSLSSAAFTSYYDSQDYEDHARWLLHLHGEGASDVRGVYLAPVNLPQGAVVNNVWFGFYDGSNTLSGSAYLIRTRWGVNQEMSTGSSGVAYNGGYVFPVPPVAYETIDNSRYSYFVFYDLPQSSLPVPPGSDDVVGTSIHIFWKPSYPVYLPLVKR